MELSSLVAAMRARLPAILADTEELVKCESPSADLEAVARSADIVAVVGARHLGSVATRRAEDVWNPRLCKNFATSSRGLIARR